MLRLPVLTLIFLAGLLLGILRFLLLLPFRRRLTPYAELRLEGQLLWRKPRARNAMERFRKPPPSVERIEELLKHLAEEREIKGVVVTTGHLHGSAPRLEAVAAALQRFRSSGKEVILYWREAHTKDLALLPVADRVLLAPGGTVHLYGYAMTLTNLRQALDKLGVVPEFFRIGDHKTAPELFTRNDPSPIQREFAERILDAQYGRLVRWIASRRGGDLEWAKETIDGGPFTSRRAVDAGLVDDLVYPDALLSNLTRGRDEAGAEGAPTPGPPEKAPETLQTAEAIVASRRWRVRPSRLSAPPIVLVVPISGIIKSGKSAQFPGGPGFCGDETVVRQLEAARRNPRVRGVVVYGDSRGGAAGPSELLWRAVSRCAEEKPTAAYVESVAASGGYFAISGSRRIFAAPNSLVGSIGVFAGRLDLRGLLSGLGVRREVLLRGAQAGLLSPSHPLGPEERRIMEAEIRQVYEDFVDRVAEGRKVGREEILPHGEGRVFVAQDAPSALVDQIGDLRDAVSWVAKEASLDPAKVELLVPKQQSMGLRSLPSFVHQLQTMATSNHWLIDPSLPSPPTRGLQRGLL